MGVRVRGVSCLEAAPGVLFFLVKILNIGACKAGDNQVGVYRARPAVDRLALKVVFQDVRIEGTGMLMVL